MKPPRFDYLAPATVDEALRLLAQHGDQAKVLAGGQSLIPLLSLRLLRPGHIVDLNELTGLDGIREEDGWLVIGGMTRQRAVEDSALVTLECESGIAFTFDISWNYVGYEERWWFETLSSRGSARLAPLRVVKELNGKPTDVSPGGAAARESSFNQSYRAELAHFLSVVREETPYEAPTDQLVLHKVVEAAYRSADEGKEVKL